MTDNYFEYAVDEKLSGKNLTYRILLISFYVIFSLAFFLCFCLIGVPQIIAILPILLLILVRFTWKYVSVTHEYIIATGEITFVHIYGNRYRKVILNLLIRDLMEVAPDDGQPQPSIDKMYDFRSASNTPDSYYLIFQREDDKRCLLYFEATKKALKLMQLYNPGAVRLGKNLRY